MTTIKNISKKNFESVLEKKYSGAEKGKRFPFTEGKVRGFTYQFPAKNSLPKDETSIYSPSKKNRYTHVATYVTTYKKGFVFPEQKKYVKMKKLF
jgi:hypothetical protein